MKELCDTSVSLIMLIDDSEIDCYINKFIIKDLSELIKVTSFSEAIQALDYLIANSDDHTKIPDIIFLDIHMPIMDGFDFLEEYARLSENILNKCSVYILSSSFDPCDIKRAKENEYVKGFIEKPLTEESILNILERNYFNL
ncbi:MAG: response regulator [Bacteroidetes bacterium]|nr:response regulator [Bacteroidota bacterium]